MREGVKWLVLSVCQFVCQFVSPVKIEYRQVETVSIEIVKKVTYVYLIESKVVLYPLLF